MFEKGNIWLRIYTMVILKQNVSQWKASEKYANISLGLTILI